MKEIFVRKFEAKKVEEFLKSENKYISEVFSFTSIPERNEQNESYEEVETPIQKNNTWLKNRTSRARSLEELQQRLNAFTSKKKLTYKEKLLKKGIKNRMKKKNMKTSKNVEIAMHKETRLLEKNGKNNDEEQADKIIFNKDDKMVFSKFNFDNLGKTKKEKKIKEPKQILRKIQEEHEKIEKLKESGDVEKAIKIKEKYAWKNALAKAAGEKVKDDPALLKKTLKKNEQKQRSSKKKWEQRIQLVEKTKEERQKKRQENIQKRKKEKKTKQLKKAAKRGKIIPGL